LSSWRPDLRANCIPRSQSSAPTVVVTRSPGATVLVAARPSGLPGPTVSPAVRAAPQLSSSCAVRAQLSSSKPDPAGEPPPDCMPRNHIAGPVSSTTTVGSPAVVSLPTVVSLHDHRQALHDCGEAQPKSKVGGRCCSCCRDTADPALYRTRPRLNAFKATRDTKFVPVTSESSSTS